MVETGSNDLLDYIVMDYLYILCLKREGDDHWSRT